MIGLAPQFVQDQQDNVRTKAVKVARAARLQSSRSSCNVSKASSPNATFERVLVVASDTILLIHKESVMRVVSTELRPSNLRRHVSDIIALRFIHPAPGHLLQPCFCANDESVPTHFAIFHNPFLELVFWDRHPPKQCQIVPNSATREGRLLLDLLL